jgi:predicted DCC family thiol-disulfide oxidoreductase YuxK
MPSSPIIRGRVNSFHHPVRAQRYLNSCSTFSHYHQPLLFEPQEIGSLNAGTGETSSIRLRFPRLCYMIKRARYSVTTKSPKAIILYDGRCPLCQKSVALLRRLDWLRRLSYQDARDVEHLPATNVPLDPERLLQEMHLLTPDRQRTYSGFKAFRWIAGRLPVFWLMWPLLFVPGIPWLGRRIYRWIARHRYHLVPCRNGTCAVTPPGTSSVARTPTT